MTNIPVWPGIVHVRTPFTEQGADYLKKVLKFYLLSFSYIYSLVVSLNISVLLPLLYICIYHFIF